MVYINLLTVILMLKGQSHEIFDPRFFSLNCTPGSPDLWAKKVLHIDSNSRRYSIKFDDENRLELLREFESTVYSKPLLPMNQGTQRYRLTKKTRVENLVGLSL
jgi:hypothetical protein